MKVCPIAESSFGAVAAKARFLKSLHHTFDLMTFRFSNHHLTILNTACCVKRGCLLFYSLAKLEADDADNEDATDEAFRNLQDEKIKFEEFLKVRTSASKLPLKLSPGLECIGFSWPTPCKAVCSL
jgi:hypothetical protein